MANPKTNSDPGPGPLTLEHLAGQVAALQLDMTKALQIIAAGELRSQAHGEQLALVRRDILGIIEVIEEARPLLESAPARALASRFARKARASGTPA